MWSRCYDLLQEVGHGPGRQCSLGQVERLKVVKVDGKWVRRAGAAADPHQLTDDVPYLHLWVGGGRRRGEKEGGEGGRDCDPTPYKLLFIVT